MSEELKEAHTEATKEQSPEEIAAAVEFEQISGDLPKSVLLVLAKQHGITSDALNISPSKFGKMNKDDLAAAIRAGAPEAEKAKAKPAEDDFDVLGFGVALFSAVNDARAKNDFKKVDNLLMQTVTERLTKDERTASMATNSHLITNLIYGGVACYAVARFVGFDVIAEKAANLKHKYLGGKKVEPKTDAQSK